MSTARHRELPSCRTMGHARAMVKQLLTAASYLQRPLSAIPHNHRSRRHLVALMVSLLAGCSTESLGERQGATDPWLEGGFVVEETPPTTRSPFATSKTVLFLNFNGVTLIDKSYSDAAKNYSSIGKGGVVPPFVGDAQKVFVQVKTFFAPFDVEVVTTRPASGDYLMAAVGGDQTNLGVGGAWVWGLAPLSCGFQNARGVAVIFSGRIAQKKVAGQPYEYTVASTTAHEVAHLMGMVHVVDACDLLSITRHLDCKNGHSFRDATLPLVGAPSATCNRSDQNSFQLLAQRLGLKQGSDTSQPMDSGLADRGRVVDLAADAQFGADSATADAKSAADSTTPAHDTSRADAATSSRDSGCAVSPGDGPWSATLPLVLALVVLGFAIRGAAGSQTHDRPQADTAYRYGSSFIVNVRGKRRRS